MMEPAHHKTNPCVSNRYTTEARDSPFLVYSIGTIQIQTRSAWTKGSSLDQDLDEKGISDAGTRQLQGHGKAKARWVGEPGLACAARGLAEEFNVFIVRLEGSDGGGEAVRIGRAQWEARVERLLAGTHRLRGRPGDRNLRGISVSACVMVLPGSIADGNFVACFRGRSLIGWFLAVSTNPQSGPTSKKKTLSLGLLGLRLWPRASFGSM